MHDAPSVTCPVGRSSLAGAIVALLWLAGAAATALWSAQPQVAGWRLGAGWIAVAAGGFASLRMWWQAPEGELAWDGAAWTWTVPGGACTAGQLRAGLDLQHAILARWHDDTGRRWFWLERRRCRERWDDLRRAVYSRARPEALTADEPPAAKP